MRDEREIAALAERLEAMGAPIGLPIEPAYRPNVARALAGLLDAAEFLSGLPLGDTVEPAGTYRP